MPRDPWAMGVTEVWEEEPGAPGLEAKCEEEVAAVAEEGEEAGADPTRRLDMITQYCCTNTLILQTVLYSHHKINVFSTF